MSSPVKFKLRIVKYDDLLTSSPFPYNEEYSNLRVTTSDAEPTGIRKNIATVYEDLTSIDDIVAKIVEYFSNEKCDHFKFDGSSSCTYEEDQGITVDEEDLKERLKSYMELLERYGKLTWSCQFDAQGYMDVEWSTNAMYVAQLKITEP